MLLFRRCFHGDLPYCSHFRISNTFVTQLDAILSDNSTGQLLKGTRQCKNDIDKKFFYQWPIVKQLCCSAAMPKQTRVFILPIYRYWWTQVYLWKLFAFKTNEIQANPAMFFYTDSSAAETTWEFLERFLDDAHHLKQATASCHI